MKFQNVRFTAQVDAPPDVVFGLIADPATYPSWAGVSTAVLERPGTDTPFGVGAIRRMTAGRTTGREEVVRYDESSGFGYILLSGLPLRDYRGDVDLEPVDGGTRVTWRSTFRPKVPLTGALSQRAMQKFIEGLVRGLATHVASEAVPNDQA